jgi:hypothetical protein
MPSINSTLLTVKYMINVKDGVFWCPRYDYLKMRPCPRPPLKYLLIEELEKELKAFKEIRNTGIDEKHQPDNDWLLLTISTLNPNHRYFHKDYVPSLVESRKIFGKIQDFKDVESDEDIKIHDDFYDNLPEDIFDSKKKNSIIPKSNS